MIHMRAEFHRNNRARLFDGLPEGAAAVFFSGRAPRQSADAYYRFFADRNFLYLTGVDFAGLALVAVKSGGAVRETMYILPPDALKERWTGRRPKAAEVTAQSGVLDVRDVALLETDLHRILSAGDVHTLYLDLYRHTPDEQPDAAHRFAARVQKGYPAVEVRNILPALKTLRTLKAPCEIAAMRRAMTVTREGILRMMRASRPGMYEYEYKAEFDYALTKNGVLAPAFHSIISAGQNNFCIHYDGYTGRAEDGDMILNDVGAQWDNECNDVSRGWPANGRFTREQRMLYTCALKTSDYMFSVIRPGMNMDDVDKTARRFCYGELKKCGLLSSFDEIGTYMWHGGAHHVGYDVHDVVDAAGKPIQPNMVFCVDIGIYAEELGIGFRVEDNCLVTPTGCENLSAAVPRTIEEIEAVMGEKKR